MSMRKLGLAIAVLAILAFVLVPTAVLAKKPPKPPPDPEPDPDPAIAYTDVVWAKGKYTTRLMVMNADGSNKTEVWSTGGSGSIRGLDWSPDGTKLSLATAVDGSRGIYTINLDGTGLTRVIQTPLMPFGAAWSPAPVPNEGGDKVRIAYTLPDANGEHLCLVDLAGDDPITLINDADDQAGPTWSPDGKRLAFLVRDHDPQTGPEWGLYDFRQTTSSYTVQDFTIAGETVTNAYAPDWSKSQSDKIAWTVSISGPTASYADIWILDVEGDDSSYPRRLTSVANISEEYASWSPDDQKLTFLSSTYTKKGRAAFEVMDADGTDREKILDGAWPMSPRWRRNLTWPD